MCGPTRQPPAGGTGMARVGEKPVQIQFSKFSQSPNCEPELPAVVRTRTRTELELTVQFGQFGPNRRFGTELRQPYCMTSFALHYHHSHILSYPWLHASMTL